MIERAKLTIERTFDASINDVWELWTTREGIESWWGPEGFLVTVRHLDLRSGGELAYAMTATGPEQADYMKKAGMQVTTEHRIIYTEVVPRRRIAYKDIADFIPGVEPYEVQTVVEFHETSQGVHVLLTFDRMHDEQWTRMAVMGRESELDRLEKLLAARS